MTPPNDTVPGAQAPAATLLFQAPAFQEPTFTPPPAPASRERESEVEEPAPRKRRTRSSKKQAEPAVEAEAPAAEASDEAEDAPAPRRSRRSRRASSERGTSVEAEESAASTEDETPEETAAEETRGEEEPAEGTTRRRRRRRSRSSQGEEDESADSEVKALKGSTRLEAKKQRRREGRKEGRRRHVITESEFLARRESVTRRMVIRHQDGLDQIAIIEDDLLVEHYVARRTQQSMVGNIYLGRVQNVLPSMEAAFVDIGRGRNAVLYAGEVNWDAVGLEGRPRRIESALKSGDPVLVQVTKDPIGHKGARLTSQITLAGRYLVLIPGGAMMGISRKLPDTERTRLKKILKKVVPAGSGVIVRTAAEGASEEQLSDDVTRLVKQWEDIERKQKQAKSAPVLLRGEPELAVRVVRDIFNEDFTSLVIQGRETYQTIKEYVDELSPELSDRVEQWVGTQDVFAANRVDEQLAKGMDRKVWLPSGGTLIIDRTEAMTVIDVNTGKFIGAGGTLEETVTKNNLEAAEEIVRQLRLRDIGGIVIIDFVDMVLEQNRDLVLRRLVECLGRDRTRHQVTEITSLGLVQMTRKRVGEGLVEAFSTTCDACEGRGFIVHHHPVEHQGGGDHSGAGKSRKKKAKAEEPRRIEDDAERERVREAVSAIAAASASAQSKDHDHVDTPAVAAEPEAVPSDGDGAAPEVEAVETTPAKGGRRSTSSKSSRQGSSGRRRATADSSEVEVAPAGSEPAAEEAPATKTTRRRRAASSGDVDTAPAEGPDTTAESSGSAGAREVPAIELPAARGRRTRQAAKLSTADIVLPERSGDAAPEAPAPTKRRRRVAASSEVVDTGAAAVDQSPSRGGRRTRSVSDTATAPQEERTPVTAVGEATVAEAPTSRPRRRRAVSTGVVDA